MKKSFSIFFGLALITTSLSTAFAAERTLCGNLGQLEHACEGGSCNDFALTEARPTGAGPQLLYAKTAKIRGELQKSLGKQVEIVGSSDDEDSDYLDVKSVKAVAACAESN